MGKGEPLKFFGKTAYTATSVAKLAIKYDAVLIPFFSERQSDGISFELFFDKSIPHGEPTEMTQHLNDLLERRIRDNMDQWLWTHKRWKRPPTCPKQTLIQKFITNLISFRASFKAFSG